MAQFNVFDEAQLKQLQQIAAVAENPEGIKRALIAERCFGLSVFLDKRQQTMLFSGAAGNPTTGGATFRGRMIAGLHGATGQMAGDRAYYLDTMAQWIALTSVPTPQALAKLQTLPPPALGRFYVISGMLLPAVSLEFSKHAEALARSRTLQSGLAIQRYRLASGRMPDNLECLTPSYLDRVPQDPFDGAPLRLVHRDSGGFAVYSIGADLTDQGGPPLDSKKTQANRDVGVLFLK